jgi:hypothetical protein
MRSRLRVTVPINRDDAVTFLISPFPCGAANLIDPTPASEVQRLKNRRVQFDVQKFPKV